MDEGENRADDGSEPSTDADATRTASNAPRSAPRDRIGPYTLLQKLGEGGMGEVWLAEQKTPVRRRVALKLIKPGMDSARVVARFEAERQALALMSHPNIAQVIDAGTTDTGGLYFVMEHVEGVPITKHCDQHKLTTQQRLELFLEVCEGLQHAHQKGIIHRDIKPSNVLVAVKGERRVPKLIDFGVAKAAAQKLTERTLFTELGQLVGTPEYMSPEQAEMTAEDIDTRSDIYSLGVLLYELLVGALPFDSVQLRSAGFDELRRKIREDEPPRPSTRVGTLGEHARASAQARSTDPGSLRKRLRGDLDWIAMKALAKDRTRRYGSAAELANDIRRHLRHEPVEAGPPSLTYKAGRFVRRHRIGVAVAGVALAVLIGVGLRERIQAERFKSERDEAIWRGYELSMQAAVDALEAGRVELARTHLDSCPQELRGWEWRMVRGSLPAPSRTMTLEARDIKALRLTEDSRLRVLSQERDSTFVSERKLDGADTGQDWVTTKVIEGPGDSRVWWGNYYAVDASQSRIAACDVRDDRLDLILMTGPGKFRKLWSSHFDCTGRPAFAGGTRFVAATTNYESEPTLQELRAATKVFDASSGEVVAELPMGDLAGAAELPLLAIFGGETLELHDLETGRVVQRLSVPIDDPGSFILTSRGERAFLGYDEGLLLAVDFAEHGVTRIKTGCSGEIDALTALPHGERAAFGTSEGVVGVVEQGVQSRQVRRLAGAIQSLTFRPDGSGLLAADDTHSIASVPLEPAEGSWFQRSVPGFILPTRAIGVRFGRGGELAAAITWDEEGLMMLDGRSLRFIERVYPEATGLRFSSFLHWSADGRRLMAHPLWNTDAETVGIHGWSVGVDGRTEPSFVEPVEEMTKLDVLGVASDARSWLRETRDGGIALEQADSGSVNVRWEVPPQALPGPPGSALWDELRGRWLVNGRNSRLIVLDGVDGRVLTRNGSESVGWASALDPTGQLLLVTRDGPALGFVDASTLQLVESVRFPYPDHAVQEIRFTPSGDRFLIGFSDGQIEVWSTARRRPIVTMKARSAAGVRSLDATEDGRLLVAFDDALIALGPWDVEP